MSKFMLQFNLSAFLACKRITRHFGSPVEFSAGLSYLKHEEASRRATDNVSVSSDADSAVCGGTRIASQRLRHVDTAGKGAGSPSSSVSIGTLDANPQR